MKRITVLKKRMKKKLTVRTLSFIMAAGLLLIVVPFVAIASGSEKPEPGKRGDFRLLKDFYAVTQVTLEEDMASNPKVSAECSSAESYQWQAYSRGQERYADLPNYVGSDLSISVSFARQYNYGNGESYFRCLATDSDGNLLISDVLTVVLPKPQVKETEETQTEETGATISTIELLEPTQPGETEPTETVESTTAPTEETTAPTEETTAPAEETTAPTTAPTQPTEEDSDPPKGSLVIPDTEEDEDVPLRGMLLVPLRAVETTYTVNYYIQKPEYTGTDDIAADYVLYKTESVTANVGDAVDLKNNKPGTSFDAYLTRHATLGNATGTVAADGASVFNVYFIRETFTFIIAWSPPSWYATDYFKLSTKHGEVTVDGSHPYEFYAKFGESLIGLWPTDDMITQRPFLISRLQYIGEKNGGNVHFVYLDDATITKLRTNTGDNNATVFDTFSFYFGFYSPYNVYVANYYLETTDGNWNSNPDYSAQSTTNTIFNTHPAYEGFWFERSERISRYTRAFYYRRNQYKLKYNVNGGDPSPTEKNVRFEETLSASTYNLTPTKDANTFGGWYYDNSFTTAVNWDTDTMPMRDVDIYAKWIPDVAEYTLTVNKNNGTADDTFTVASGNMLSTAGITQPTRTGYEFDAWYTDSGFSAGSKIDDLASYTMPAHNLDIYAKWNPIPHTITFNNTGESMATVNYGATLDGTVIPANPAPDAAHTGRTFDCWCSDATLETPYTFPATMPNEDIVVYARWKYTVKFYLSLDYAHSNASTDLVLTVENVTHGSVINDQHTDYGQLSALDSRNGKLFGGWYYDADNPKIPQKPAVNETPFVVGETPIMGNMNIYAAWSFTLTYLNDKDGTINTTKEALRGTVPIVEALAIPERNYYSSEDNAWWYEETENGNTVEKKFVFEGDTSGEAPTVVGGNMTLYPKWQRNNITLNIHNKYTRDNIFTVKGGGVDLQVVVPAGTTVSVVISEKQLPFGTYTVSATNWDFRSIYTLANTPLNAATAKPGDSFDTVEAEGAAKENLFWLGGELRTTLTPGSAG